MKNIETTLISAPKLDTLFLVNTNPSISGDYATYIMAGYPYGRTVKFAKDKLVQNGPNNLIYNGDSVISHGSWMSKETDGVIA